MHDEVQTFFKGLKTRFPSFFQAGLVLEIGSKDINGTVRHLFGEALVPYGIDLSPGPNVDEVCHAVDFPQYLNGTYDFVFSTEALEHDSRWKETLRRMTKLIRPGGLVAFTCAGSSRGEHGTYANVPEDSPDTNDWYHNLSVYDVEIEMEPRDWYNDYMIILTRANQDLQFYGIKKGE